MNIPVILDDFLFMSENIFLNSISSSESPSSSNTDSAFSLTKDETDTVFVGLFIILRVRCAYSRVFKVSSISSTFELEL